MEQNQVVLQTKLGKLRGHTCQSVFSNKTYYAFQGIPYAKPPLGKLRFKAPLPFGSWEGTRDALADGSICKQPPQTVRPEGSEADQLAEGDEDCLYLNVFTNKLPETGSSLKPVMFIIHGGAFLGGSGGIGTHGPDLLLEGDVVFVSINYRCGAFGFLSLETAEVPGNAGLKDQNLALQWVRDNIDSFGGDPNNVTISGISAGAASVHFHMLSPMSKGLFHKAIIQSGCAQNPWPVQPTPKKAALSLAKALGCNSNNIDDILVFLQSASADDIVVASKEITENEGFFKNFGFIFKPCVEVCGANPFLTDTPDNLMKKGEFANVPVILGGVVNEGSVIPYLSNQNEEEFTKINENPEQLVPPFLQLKPGSNEERKVQKAIWDFYFHGKPLSWDNFGNYLKYHSDYLFCIGLQKFRSGLLEHSSSPLYTYLFTNHSRCLCPLVTKSIFPEDFSKIITPDTCHGSDSIYLFVLNVMPQEITPDHKEDIFKHIKAWTTFASVGDPNTDELGATWERDSLSKPCYMEIGTTWDFKSGICFSESIEFWKKQLL